MDSPSSRPHASSEQQSSRNRHNDSPNTRSSRANIFIGGDPFVASSAHSAFRSRFTQRNSAHRSVQTDPSPSQPKPTMTVEQPISTPSVGATSTQFSRVRKTVSRDNTHTVPSIDRFRDVPEKRLSRTTNRTPPIAHPHRDPSLQHSSFSRPVISRQTSNQPRPPRHPTNKPAVPERETIISSGDDEAAINPNFSEPSHPAPRAPSKPPPDVVDLDGDDYIPIRQPSKRPRTNVQATAHANTGDRNHRLRLGLPRSNRKPPSTSKVVITGSPSEPFTLPRLKHHTTHAAKVATANDVGKVLGGGNTPTRIDEQETVIVDEVECTQPKDTKRKMPSLADVFASPIKFDEDRANEVMARCQRERRSMMMLSFLGMTDVDLQCLWHEHAPPKDGLERSLVLRNNHLTKFTYFMREKTEEWNVTSLDLSHNCMSLICDISRRLRILNLSRNKLTRFPDGIEKLSELELLDLSHNNIREAPQQLHQLKKLEILDLSGNYLESLPSDCFGEDSKLRVLLISCNLGIDSLPACAAHLTELKVFQFEKTVIHSNLPKADLRLEAAELVRMLAGKDARTLAKRRAPGGRELRSRRDHIDEVKIVT
eukprot:GFKZ01016053.1.p1 GENE.GFKZ01016053.1~~GFKZ01016053.1.p1  ORF type:complete len:596 (-),score=77.04 GFKZ01016053.1:549-2336(-)